MDTTGKDCKRITSAMAITERMRITTRALDEATDILPYGTDDEVMAINRMTGEIYSKLTCLRMRAEAALARVEYETGGITEEELEDRIEKMFGENCIIGKRLWKLESELGIRHIQDLSSDDDEDSEYRIQEE